VAEELHAGAEQPGAERGATADYFSTQDIFSEWIDDKCEVGPTKRENPTRLWGSWKAYAERHNENPGTQPQFRERLEARGHPRKKADDTRFYAGISVALEEHPPHWSECEK
jgi:putative DNA primase/helicase